MRVPLDGITVLFPYDYVYPEQFDYMLALKRTLDNGRGHCLLEMPTGTGKTVSLLSLIVSYQMHYPEVGKLVYCTRTVQEMDKVMEEVRRVFDYVREELKSLDSNPDSLFDHGSSSLMMSSSLDDSTLMSHHHSSQDIEDIPSEIVSSSTDIASLLRGKGKKLLERNLCVCLSARRNLCVHPQVSKYDDRGKIDALCRNRTASWVRASKLENEDDDDPSSSSSSTATALRSSSSLSKSARVAHASSRGLCEYFEGFEADGNDAELRGIYSLEDLKRVGRERHWCPYFLARRLIGVANIVVYNYQYILDPKIANLVSKDLSSDCIVVFDEAHNIDNICIEALSVRVDKRAIHSAVRNLRDLQNKVGEMERVDADRLNQEYQALLRGLRLGAGGLRLDGGPGPSDSSAASASASSSDRRSANGSSSVGLSGLSADATDLLLATPVLINDQISTLSRQGVMVGDSSSSSSSSNSNDTTVVIPGNIRKARNFMTFLQTIVEYIKQRMDSVECVITEDCRSFMEHFQRKTGLKHEQVLAMQFTHDRLHTLFRTLKLTNLDSYLPVTTISTLVSIIGTYHDRDGFRILLEPFDTRTPGIRDPLLRVCCLDASIAMKPVLDKFRNVIITSGTLSPLDFYPKILRIPSEQLYITCSFDMTLSRPCILPLIISKGNDQIPVTSKFVSRKDLSVVKNYGELLVSLCSVIPDGIVCFFTSYHYLEETVSEWSKLGILEEIMSHKLLFLETKDIIETSLALDSFKKACDIGRGACFLSVARGKIAEGIDFDSHYGRCVILFGIPFQYSLSRSLRLRLEFLKEHFDISESNFLSFDALRQSAQCVGRVIRSKLDYGLMVFADYRFAHSDKRRKLPQWIGTYLTAETSNLSTDVACELASRFVKEMAQPHSRTDEIGRSLLTEKDIRTRWMKRQQQMSDLILMDDDDDGGGGGNGGDHQGGSGGTAIDIDGDVLMV